MDDVILGIGIPLSWPFCPSDFFDSFVMMDKPNPSHVIRASSGPIQEMRNVITTRALEMGCTHLAFLDADMVYPQDTLTRLLAHDKDIIGGLCFKRWPPFPPTLFEGDPYEMKLMDPYPEGLVRVTATGTGCLLIDCKVFEEMTYPWWEFAETKEGGPVGEDVNFCYKAGELGYVIHVDTTIKIDHLCQMRVNENIWKLNKSLIETKQGNFNF